MILVSVASPPGLEPLESSDSPFFSGTVVLRRLTRGGEGQHAADGPRESVVTMLALFL